MNEINIEQLYKEAVAYYNKNLVTNEASQKKRAFYKEDLPLPQLIDVWIISSFITGFLCYYEKYQNIPHGAEGWILDCLMYLSWMFTPTMLFVVKAQEYFSNILVFGPLSFIYNKKLNQKFYPQKINMSSKICDSQKINLIIKYLTNGPISQNEFLCKKIDKAIQTSESQIALLSNIIANLNNTKHDLEFLVLSRIEMASNTKIILEKQIVELIAQKQDAINAVTEVKELSQKLGAIYSTTQSIQEIQNALGIVDKNEVLILENNQAIYMFKQLCDSTVNKLNDIQKEIKYYESAKIEVESETKILA